jgi:hypothetical protein
MQGFPVRRQASWIELGSQMLRKLFDALEFFDHILGQQALLHAGSIKRYGLGNPGQFVSILADPG